ncbi:MAG: molybdenum cofactor biosysynthesis protein, partial [Verrucomicrobiota bacterium]
SKTRRNVITTGVNLNELIGKRFDIQNVQFEGIEECRPCHWMDQAFAPGAEQWLKGRGGLRARILTNGVLRSSS